MKIRNSLALPIIFILVFVAFSTLFVGYYFNIQILRKSLESREEDKTRDILFIINSMINEEIKNLAILSKVLREDKDLAAGLVHYHKSGGDLEPLQKVMDLLYSKMDTEIFLVTDFQGIVVYRANDPGERGDDHNVWGMDEALAGEDIVTSIRGPQGWAIRALAPVMADQKVQGVLFLGTRINDNFAQKIADATNTQISFGTPKGIVASSSPSELLSWTDTDTMDIMEHSILEKRSFFIKDDRNYRTLLCTPISIVDETFSLIVVTEFSEIAALLKEKQRQLILLAMAIFIVVIALGSALTFYLISPLGKLRFRALSVIKEISGEDPSLEVQGNEVQTLSQAFDLMLLTLRNHIKELKQAEEALRESEKRFRDIADNALEWIWEVDAQGQYTYSNPLVQKLLGYKPDEVINKHFYDFFHPDDREELTQAAFETFAAKRSFREFTNRNIHKNNEVIWLLTSGVPILDENGNLLGYRGADIDITARKQAEEALREGERFLASIFASIQDGLNVLDRELNIVRVNPAMERWYDHALPLVGQKCYEAYQRRSEPCLLCPSRQTLETGEVASEVIPKIGALGEVAGWLEVYSFPLLDTATGKMKGVIEFIRDITQRKQAETSLERLGTRNRLILESAVEGIFGLDLSGNHTFVNPAAARMLGYEVKELIGRHSHSTWHHSKPDGSPYPEEECQIYKVFKKGLVHNVPITDEVFWRKDGTSFPVEYTCAPISEDGKIMGAVVTFWDITKRKQAEEALQRTEEQLRQAMKMEAVGRLAGGVAHDFNNILTAVSGYSDLLLLNLKDQDLLHKDVEEIQKATERAASLTRQLLAFSRKQIFQPKVLDLNELVTNLDKMLQRLLGEDINLVTIPAPGLGQVLADPGQMEQIILNLVVNSRDAMPQGGKLTIETANVDLGEAYARQHLEVTPGPYVMLAVSDTGVGLNEETQSRIFEPFFTTKEQGRGTGLGLSTVYGIVKQSGGHIWVYSEPGQGTTFKIYLPRVDKLKEQVALVPTSAAAEQGTETILLVEDEALVRQVTRRILQHNGYTVLEAGGGSEALLLSDRHPGPIHLTLTDVIMPEMSGRELVDNLILQRPEMKVLYMSGHTENAIVHHGVLDPGIAFIQKPFRHDLLVQKVRQVLET